MEERVEERNEIKIGMVLSYALLFVNTLYGLLITPYILRYVGNVDYGVYKSIASLTSTLAVMDLGLGATMTRYMARFRATKDAKGASNFAAMVLIQYMVLAALLLCFGVIIYQLVPILYDEAFSPDEIVLARRLFVFLILNMALRLLENLLMGVANGYERFKITNGLMLLSVILKFSLILVLLPMTKNVMLMVVLESILAAVLIVIFWFYIKTSIGITPKLAKWDKAIFKESMGYTMLMFIQTITIQFNGNVDNLLIGALLGPVSVTVYSMALVIFGMYGNLSASVANVMLPNMTKRVLIGQSPEELQAAIERAGRLQFMLLSMALGGFVVLGRDFYSLWLGEGFADCYGLTLILMIPITFTMVQNVCLSVLRAENRMLYRTITLLISCVLNVIVTVIGLRIWGYWGAAIGTSCATVANLIFMNVYYHKRLRFHIAQMFGNIFKRILLCAAAATCVTYIVHKMLYTSWLAFVFNIIVYIGVYGVLLLAWGMDEKEKSIVLERLARRK